MAEIFGTFDGVRTRYFEKGSGDPLVLIHGGQYGGLYSADAWGKNFDELSNHFHVYAFDKLGMGHTDNPTSDQDYSIDATIKHARPFIETLGLDNVSLFGHSRGAFLAGNLAVENPNLVKTLIVADSNSLAPSDPKGPSAFAFYGKVEEEYLKVPVREGVALEPRANSYTYDHITENWIDEMVRIAELSKHIEGKAKSKELATTVFFPSLAKKKDETLDKIRAGALTMPTLVMWGYNDPSAPLKLGMDLMDILQEKVERYQFHIFNKAGHYAFREHARSVNPLVRDFITINKS